MKVEPLLVAGHAKFSVRADNNKLEEGQLVSPSIHSALLEEYTWTVCRRSDLQKLQALLVASRWKLLVQQPKQPGIVEHDARCGGGVPPF